MRTGVDINTIRARLGHAKLDTIAVLPQLDFETKAKSIATCSMTAPERHKPWSADADTMAFLPTRATTRVSADQPSRFRCNGGVPGQPLPFRRPALFRGAYAGNWAFP